VEAILAFKEDIEASETGTRPFPKFHHCPYIGLAGSRQSRAGCLLHPLAEGNHGTDFRGLSYYGGLACRVYFCPTYRELSSTAKKIIVGVASDWHLYGLVITEVTMLAAFFAELENRLGHPLNTEAILSNINCRYAVNTFLGLKLTWPFRYNHNLHPANYFFEDRLYRNAPIDYNAIGTPPSRYDPILRALNTLITSRDDLHRAETIVDQILDRLTGALEK